MTCRVFGTDRDALVAVDHYIAGMEHEHLFLLTGEDRVVAVGAALEFEWQNWDRVARMELPVAYLFRVGLSKSRRRKLGIAPAFPPAETAHAEPELISAIQGLARHERDVVWLVEACD